MWARRWRAEGCSWSAVPRGFALSSILAEIRATEPCKRLGTGGRLDLYEHGRAQQWRILAHRGASERAASRRHCIPALKFVLVDVQAHHTTASSKREHRCLAIRSGRAGFAIQVNQGWILADERYCVQGRTRNPAVQHHADAQPNFWCSSLRLAFGRAKIFSRPRHHVGFSD